jgi:site-specific recombinase XerD
LGWLLDGFCKWELERGTVRQVVQHHVRHVVRFSRGCEPQAEALKNGEAWELLSVLEARVNRVTPESERRRARSAVHRLGQYLAATQGASIAKPEEPPLYAPLLAAYLHWLREVRQNTEETIAWRRRKVVPFLAFLGDIATPDGLSTVGVDQIRAYAVSRMAERGYAVRVAIVGALRSFLQFCHLSGYLPTDLSRSIPSVRSYALSDTPRGLGDEQAQKVLESIDRDSALGKRDYAILQLLYTYGVRNGQVRTLRMEDIDWREDRILFRPQKRGKRSLLPLTDDVGDALLDYLRNGRPQVAFPEVFVTALAPFRPLRYSSALTGMIVRRIRHVGIELNKTGTHAFRYCFVSRMVNRGHSLKNIADILGHRRLATTFIYTKVDFRNLSQVALEWPGAAE